MSEQSDTPRTNEAAWPETGLVEGDFARQLERELAAVTEQRDQWKDKYLQQNKDLGYELRDPNGTIWSECKRLQTELTAARAEIEAIMETLKSPIEVELDMIRGKIAIPNRSCLHYIAQIKEVTEQRDRLAVALKELRNNESMSLGGAAYEIVDQALQSLTRTNNEHRHTENR